jgi:hypothetical protein
MKAITGFMMMIDYDDDDNNNNNNNNKLAQTINLCSRKERPCLIVAGG